MISRLWRGWTTPQNADAYERLLRTDVFPGIVARRIPGFQGIQLLRRNVEGETEFVTIMWFDTLDSVRAFAGNDYERAVVPLAARQLLRRFDERSAHFQLRDHHANG